MDVMAWSRNLTDESAAEHGVARAGSLAELLEAGDFVSVHLQLGERTRGPIGAGELKRMRRTAYLVNTSRAAIVDQEALVQALREGWLAGAGADVFEQEPLPAGIRCARLPTSSGCRTPVMSPAATTRGTSARRSRTSRRIWQAGRSVPS
ncbi:hypothetical protein GCM10010381_17090 [Streptomyces xantholiticus]|nr:hypothetical protein GCM10010381_17090 [Streptomyces xantholiticus]